MDIIIIQKRRYLYYVPAFGCKRNIVNCNISIWQTFSLCVFSGKYNSVILRSMHCDRHINSVPIISGVFIYFIDNTAVAIFSSNGNLWIFQNNVLQVNPETHSTMRVRIHLEHIVLSHRIFGRIVLIFKEFAELVQR